MRTPHNCWPGVHGRATQATLYSQYDQLQHQTILSKKAEKHAMADDDIEDIDFDDDCDEQDDIEYVDSSPTDLPSKNARRELEKRLEMKRLREQLDDDF
jgi:hypothetical protein